MVADNRLHLDPEDINKEEPTEKPAEKVTPLKVNPILQSNDQTRHDFLHTPPKPSQTVVSEPKVEKPAEEKSQTTIPTPPPVSPTAPQAPQQTMPPVQPTEAAAIAPTTQPEPDESQSEEWMKNVAERRKQKLHQQAAETSTNRPRIELNLDEHQSVDIEKPILAIDEENTADAKVDKEEPSRLWLWMLLAAIVIIVIAVTALRFLGGNGQNQDAYDKPVISAEPNWKIRPEDPGGMEVPFEDLQILDTTGNARLLQNHVDLLLPTGQAEPPVDVIDETERNLQEEVASLLEAAAPSEDALTTSSDNTQITPIEETEPTPTTTTSIEKVVTQPSDIPVSDSGIAAWQVQMSSVFSEKDAKAEWQRFARRYGNIVSEQPALIVRAGNAYALRIGSFQSSRDAQSLCETIKSSGGDCLIISPR
ncbi:MAG: SPOR domain-containing protein [Alphaproteobacteria bacterium]